MELHPSIVIGTPPIVMGTPRLLNVDGSEQHVGRVLGWRRGFMHFRYCAEMQQTEPGPWLIGTAPHQDIGPLHGRLVRRKDFRIVEDVDLGIRLGETSVADRLSSEVAVALNNRRN
jgi:hypothetical protein